MKYPRVILIAATIICVIALYLDSFLLDLNAGTIIVPDEIVVISESVGRLYGIAPELLQAIAFYESSFRAGVINGNCIGLMQINVPFHRDRIDRLSVTNLYDPHQNMIVAADILAELRSRYYCVGIALMAYNGTRDPEGYFERTGELTDYAENVLNLSRELEDKRDRKR